MGGLTKSFGGLVAGLAGGRQSAGLAPLPSDLGLPPSQTVGQGIQQGKNPVYEYGDKRTTDKLNEQRVKAEAYNKAFADLLNQQPHLNGAERAELYDAYSSKVYNNTALKYIQPLTDYKSTLSQLTPDQYAAQQQQQQQAAAAPQQAAAAAPTPQPAAAVAKDPTAVAPVTPQVAATPAVATPTGNVAGQTVTTGGTESSNSGKTTGRRGRMATLLTGLGGAVERFGL